jgi:antitoxin MazE
MIVRWREAMAFRSKSEPGRTRKSAIHDILSKEVYQEGAVQIGKWGNSLAVRLPKALVDQLGLRKGDELNVVAARNGAIEVEAVEARRTRVLANMAARNWTPPEGKRLDRDEANER